MHTQFDFLKGIGVKRRLHLLVQPFCVWRLATVYRQKFGAVFILSLRKAREQLHWLPAGQWFWQRLFACYPAALHLLWRQR